MNSQRHESAALPLIPAEGEGGNSPSPGSVDELPDLNIRYEVLGANRIQLQLGTAQFVIDRAGAQTLAFLLMDARDCAASLVGSPLQ